MSNLSKIDVVILAGGFGTRLQPRVRGKPKVLAEVRGHPFLEYLLSQLNNANFKKVILCTGYLSNQVEKAFGGKYKNLHLIYSPEQIPLGTAGSLKNALPLLNSETVLVMNGDSFCEADFKKFWQFHLSKNSKVSLVLSPVSDTSRFGKVKLGIDDSIIGFQEKKAGSGGGFVNAGIYFINKTFISEIPVGKEISLEKDVFPNWIGKGFYGFRSNNNFIDIGTPESYARAQQFFAKFKL
ncbi:MAG: nucleotidyltransferase family protein [Candidatus Levybacteria bacterium]|nr:nucleotidyltransferase family protein [Candidatus Levybacteria bacterium]